MCVVTTCFLRCSPSSLACLPPYGHGPECRKNRTAAGCHLCRRQRLRRLLASRGSEASPSCSDTALMRWPTRRAMGCCTFGAVMCLSTATGFPDAVARICRLRSGSCSGIDAPCAHRLELRHGGDAEADAEQRDDRQRHRKCQDMTEAIREQLAARGPLTVDIWQSTIHGKRCKSLRALKCWSALCRRPFFFCWCVSGPPGNALPGTGRSRRRSGDARRPRPGPCREAAASLDMFRASRLQAWRWHPQSSVVRSWATSACSAFAGRVHSGVCLRGDRCVANGARYRLLRAPGVRKTRRGWEKCPPEKAEGTIVDRLRLDCHNIWFALVQSLKLFWLSQFYGAGADLTVPEDRFTRVRAQARISRSEHHTPWAWQVLHHRPRHPVHRRPVAANRDRAHDWCSLPLLRAFRERILKAFAPDVVHHGGPAGSAPEHVRMHTAACAGGT